MFQFELTKLIRNNIIALIFSYVIAMSIGINVLQFFFSDVEWVNKWAPKLTILYIVVLVDLLFWMAGMQLAQDFETKMIQVMRTSRTVSSYFFTKHLLLLLFVAVASLLVTLPYLSSIEFVLNFVYLTVILSLIMIGCGVIITMIFKKQSVLMISGSVVTGLVFLSMIRLIFPTWNIERYALNPFEYFISAYYDLFLPLGANSSNLLLLTILSVSFYFFSLFLFKQFTFKKGYRL